MQRSDKNKHEDQEAGFNLYIRAPLKGDGDAPVLQKCDPDTIDFSRPMLFCFSGVHATAEKAANGFAKAAETMLGGPAIHSQGVQILTVTYDPMERPATRLRKTLTTMVKGIEAWDRFSRPYAEKYSKSIVDTVFDRIIPDLHQAANPAQRQEAVAQCTRAMGNVNMMVFSFGSYLAPFIHHDIRQRMEERGFEDKEIVRTLKAVHVVSFGDTGLWYHQPLKAFNDGNGNRKPWDFTSVHFVSTNDGASSKVSGIDSRLLASQHKRDRMFRFGEEGNVLLFLSRLPARLLEVSRKEKEIRPLEAKAGWWQKWLDRIAGTGGHNPTAYMGSAGSAPYFSEEGGQWLMPSAVQSALRNAVRTSLEGRRGDVAELLNPVTLAAHDAANSNGEANGHKRAIPHARGVYMPDNPTYPYAERITALKAESQHISELPPSRIGAWQEMLAAHPPQSAVLQ